MNKENLKNILTKIYQFLLGKGWNETLVKILIGVAFGVICAFCFTSCTMNYQNENTKLDVEILPILQTVTKEITK